MRVLHCADSHLGFSAYRRMTGDGVNQREMDVYGAFERFIEYAIKTKPDLVVHAGDLFDAIRPNNRAISVALNGFLRLSEKGIPVVVIAGNHEVPRLSETGCIFRIFEHIPGVYPVYSSKYECIPFEIGGKKVRIHAVPYCHLRKDFEHALESAMQSTDADVEIFLGHGGVSGLPEFAYASVDEVMLPTDELSTLFDYVALGHYHGCESLVAKGNVWYAGSLERFSFVEAKGDKGCMSVEFRDDGILPSFIQLPTRPMVDADPIDCTSMGVDEVMAAVKKRVRQIDPTEKILRFHLDKIRSEVYRSMDFAAIRQVCRGAVHFEVRAEVIREGEVRQVEGSRMESLSEEFCRYMSLQQGIVDREALIEAGLSYIGRVEEGS